MSVPKKSLQTKNDVSYKYYLMKLMREKNAECIVVNVHTDGTCHTTIFRNGSICEDYDVVDNKKFQKAHKCKFKELGKKKVLEFDSLTKAAKFMGLPHSSLQYAIKKDILLIPKKSGLGMMHFEGWID